MLILGFVILVPQPLPVCLSHQPLLCVGSNSTSTNTPYMAIELSRHLVISILYPVKEVSETSTEL